VTKNDYIFSSKPRQIAQAAIKISSQIFGPLNDLNVVVLGDLDLTIDIGNNLKKKKLKQFKIFKNEYFQYFNDEKKRIKEIDDFAVFLSDYDVILIGCKSGTKIVFYDLATKILQKRKKKPVLFLDCGIPGNIEQNVGNINNCFLFDLNDLEQFYSTWESDFDKGENYDINFIDDEIRNYTSYFLKKLNLNTSQILIFEKYLKISLKKNKDHKFKQMLKSFFKSYKS